MMSARRLSSRLAVAAVREGAAHDAKRSLEPPSPCGESVAEPRRKVSKVALSGGREGLEVRAGLTEGSGMGLFAGSRGIPPGGFIALHRGCGHGPEARAVSTLGVAPMPSRSITGIVW